jgi:Zn-finger nucleic acid-binding protein
MANCSNCGAPLPLHSTFCNYCRTRNDVDLKGIHYNTTHAPDGTRICPRCNLPLQTLNLSTGRSFLIERCQGCLGLFFDPGELDALLESETTHVYDVDLPKMTSLLEERHHADYPVVYLKCPVCRQIMNRVNFGARSGVIVDKCKKHGVWLDSGELRHLLEWVKSGGAILERQRAEEKRIEEEKQTKEKAREMAREYGERRSREGDMDEWLSDRREPDLLGLLVRWAGKIMAPRP